MRAFPWKSQAYSPAFNLVMSMCGTLSARHALYPGVRPCTLNQRRPLVVQATGARYLVAGIWWSVNGGRGWFRTSGLLHVRQVLSP